MANAAVIPTGPKSLSDTQDISPSAPEASSMKSHLSYPNESTANVDIQSQDNGESTILQTQEEKAASTSVIVKPDISPSAPEASSTKSHLSYPNESTANVDIQSQDNGESTILQTQEEKAASTSVIVKPNSQAHTIPGNGRGKHEEEKQEAKNGFCYNVHTGVCSADISKCKKRIRIATWFSAIFAITCTILASLFTGIPAVPSWNTTLPANVSLFCCFTSAVGFYVAWFFYPVEKPKSCWIRMRTMFHSWQTALIAATLIIALLVRSVDLVLLFAHVVDGNASLNASRLGHVGSESFKVFHHYPKAKVISTEYKLATDDTYTMAGTTDRIGTIEVTGLAPATEYHYRVLVDGVTRVEDTKLVTAPVDGTPVKFTFTFGSCYMSQSMYGGVTWPIFRLYMMNYFERVVNKGAQFLIMLGDTYYADAPYYIGSEVPDYEIRARQALGSLPYRKYRTQLPSYFMYDDHELVNNWDAVDDLVVGTDVACFYINCYKKREIYNNGVDVFNRFFMATNPVSHPPTDPDGRKVFYFDFKYGDNDFFVMDTRAFRSRNDVDRFSASKTMLGKRQLAALKTWAQRKCTGFKFILSPVAMILMAPSNKTKDSDSWHGFPMERNAILDFLEEKNITNVVFLSGDIHIPFVAELRPGVFEFSLSPIAGFTTLKSKFGADYRLEAEKWKEKLLWKDDSRNVMWKPASFNAMVNVDTKSTPKTLTVDYYSFEDEDKSLFSHTISL